MAGAASITVELDLINDAIVDMERIGRALVKCHGSAYRELDRRFSQLVEGEVQLSAPHAHTLSGARLVMEPPIEIKAIIRDARGLGVI